MNAIAKNILTTVIATAIIANVAVLFSFNARLASIETILRLQSNQNQYTQNTHEK
jgi:hypothetical protein